jgi:hypothetical protein
MIASDQLKYHNPFQLEMVKRLVMAFTPILNQYETVFVGNRGLYEDIRDDFHHRKSQLISGFRKLFFLSDFSNHRADFEYVLDVLNLSQFQFRFPIMDVKFSYTEVMQTETFMSHYHANHQGLTHRTVVAGRNLDILSSPVPVNGFASSNYPHNPVLNPHELPTDSDVESSLGSADFGEASSITYSTCLSDDSDLSTLPRNIPLPPSTPGSSAPSSTTSIRSSHVSLSLSNLARFAAGNPGKHSSQSSLSSTQASGPTSVTSHASGYGYISGGVRPCYKVDPNTYMPDFLLQLTELLLDHHLYLYALDYLDNNNTQQVYQRCMSYIVEIMRLSVRSIHELPTSQAIYQKTDEILGIILDMFDYLQDAKPEVFVLQTPCQYFVSVDKIKLARGTIINRFQSVYSYINESNLDLNSLPNFQTLVKYLNLTLKDSLII